MHQQLHNDGDFTIYKVEIELEYTQGIAKEPYMVWQSWCVMYGHNMPLPSRVRWASDEDRYNGREQDPMRSFTANGECWQQTGIEGVFDYNKAAELSTLILEHYPSLRVRIIEQKISQHTRVATTLGPIDTI